MGKDKDLNTFQHYEVGASFFEIIEFSLIRNLPSGESISGIYGVNVAKVREVVHMPKINPLAFRIPGIAGVFELRGVPIPAINLCQILGDIKSNPIKDQQIIVTEFCGKRAGFIVDSTHRIRKVNWDKVLPPSADSLSCMSGMILLENNEFLFILDLEKILNDLEDQAMNPNGSISGQANQILSPYKTNGSTFPSNESLHTSPAPAPDLDAPGVLFVDDSKLVLNNVGKVLQQKGYRVLTASNGADGLEKVNEVVSGKVSFGKLNLVITDVEMPLMDGLTMVKSIKSNAICQNIPVILHTSLSAEVVQTAAQSVGADGYVIKNDIRSLLDLIEDILRERPASVG